MLQAAGAALIPSPLSPDDLMSWLKTFSLSLEVISAAVETLYQLGRSQDVRETQVGPNRLTGS